MEDIDKYFFNFNCEESPFNETLHSIFLMNVDDSLVVSINLFNFVFSIEVSKNLNLVPDNLKFKYTNKITRQEFCQLAVQTYIAKTGNEINMNVESPISDVDDIYITTAYNLKIVSGTGNNKFAT